LSNAEKNEGSEAPEYDEHGIPILNVRARLSEVERKAAEAETRDQNYKTRQERINRRLMIFTGLLVLTSLISGSIAIWQARIANRSAKAAESAAHTAATILEEAQKPTSDVHISAIAAQNAAKEASKANEFARDSLIGVQRAFVVVDPTPVIQPFQGDDGKRYYILYFNLENTGTTPTRNLSAYINWMTDTKPMAANYSYPDRSEKGLPITSADTKSLVPVLGPKNKSVLSPGRIPIDMIQGVRDGKRFVYIYGWTTYNDIFEKTPLHITKFSFEVVAPKGIVPNEKGQATEAIQIRLAGTRHNCYDEECQQ
jgi:cytoskeletal protein RodZ